MNRSQLQQLFSAAKKGFLLGVCVCMGFYIIIRIIFWGFEFTFLEELHNIFTIVTRGGLMFSGAIVFYLLAENMIIRLSSYSTAFRHTRVKNLRQASKLAA